MVVRTAGHRPITPKLIRDRVDMCWYITGLEGGSLRLRGTGNCKTAKETLEHAERYYRVASPCPANTNDREGK
jgi:hypothetical protein